MKNYEKPVVLLNSELSEGVYAASGDLKNYILTYKRTSSLSGQMYYGLIMINTSDSPVAELSVKLELNGVTSIDTILTVNQYGKMDVRSNLDGIITCKMMPGEEIPAHGQTEEITVVVYGTGDFGISQ